jgi:dehydrogenase/reductase SDR family member 7B
LVLCAGISAHSLFEDFKDMEPFRKVVETNLYGCVYPVRHALKHMKKDLGNPSSTKGHIVVLSSYSGEFGLWYRSPYSASKFAVNGFFESLRMELGEKIDITLVSPITV